MNNDRLSLNLRFIRMFFMFALALLMATASWAETSQDCALTFDTGDENVVVETQLVACGEVPVMPADPAREGHKFLGWWADKEGNNAFDWTKQLTANATIYAKWDVKYIDENGDEQTVEDYVLLTGNESADDGIFTKGGWYVVKDEVKYEWFDDVNNLVDVHLILADGAKLTIRNFALTFKNLTIYAQSTGENMGRIEVQPFSACAISVSQKFVLNGGVVVVSGRTWGISGDGGVTINGGVLNAYGSSSGFGSGGGVYSVAGSVTINGGVIEANGDSGVYASDIVVNDGSITAMGNMSYGIYASNNISVNGGKVETIGAQTGLYAFQGGIAINDGWVIAKGVTKTLIDAYGIYANNNISINGGKVEASGYHGIFVSQGDITIKDGSITATGISHGIRAKGDIKIDGGVVEAFSASAIYSLEGCVIVNSGTITAMGESYGIEANACVAINGGSIIAKGNLNGSVGIFSGSDVTINGGVLDAEGGNYGIRSYNDIILGWTDAENDRVTISRFSSRDGSVKTAENKAFKDEYGKFYFGTFSDEKIASIAGKPLSPLLIEEACALTFDTGDENVVVETQLVACGEVPVKPGNPARVGYKFLGWWADKEGNNAFDWTKQLTANATIYAKWQELLPVEYIDEKGEKKTVKDYLLLTGNESADDGIFTKGGWYVVQGQVTYDDGKFAFSSKNYVDVNLILADGAKLTASNTAYFNNLTIYAQSTGENMGQMDIETDGSYSYSYYSYAIRLNQQFVLNGGVVKAVGRNFGISSGTGGVTINGGVLEAVGGSYGIRTRNDIIFGWTDAENDRITVSRAYSNKGDVKIADGLLFTDGEGHIYHGSFSSGKKLASIAGKTLRPDSPIITWSTDESRVVATINGISKRKVKFGYDYDVLADNPSLYADSVVLDREFTPNKFSTLSLPFDFPAKDIQGLSMLLKFNGLKQKEVDGKKRWVVSMRKSWIANSTTDDVQLKAYRPYMLLTDSKTLTFHGPVNFVNNLTAESDAVANGGEAADLYADEINGWTFNSAYSYKMWVAGDGELGRAYGFAAKTTDNVGVGQFVKAAEGAYVYPFRAYLLMNEAPNKVRSSFAGNKAGVSTMSLPEDIDVEIEGDDGDEPKTTVIGKFNTRTGEFRMDDGAARSFDVKGRNVGNNANKARGAYYGKKLVK